MTLSALRMTFLLTVAGILAAAMVYVKVLMPPPAIAQIQQKRISFDPAEYDPQTVIPRSFPAIIKPPFVSAKEAAQLLRPNELVLGVEVDGKPRAYPIGMLTGPSREIFNDELGGTAIAATW